MFNKKAYNKEYMRRQRLTHPEFLVREKEYNKKYRLEHIKETKEAIKKWKLANPEKVKKHLKKWRLAHPEKEKENCKRFLDTLNGKTSKRKTDAKRRKLGFIPLNKYFEGSEGHHVDWDRVVYIPVGLHQENRHSLLRNYNMTKINTIAFNFLSGRRE